jgi:hypothetical protein
MAVELNALVMGVKLPPSAATLKEIHLISNVELVCLSQQYQVHGVITQNAHSTIVRLAS